MGWEINGSIVFLKYRNNNVGGAERKLLYSYLGNWVDLTDHDVVMSGTRDPPAPPAVHHSLQFATVCISQVLSTKLYHTTPYYTICCILYHIYYVLCTNILYTDILYTNMLSTIYHVPYTIYYLLYYIHYTPYIIYHILHTILHNVCIQSTILHYILYTIYYIYYTTTTL